MKRYLLWIMLVCLLPLGGAGAEVQRYAIRDLPAVTSPRWEQTYTAYGRTIQVSEEIQIPRVDSAPVLTVRAAPPVADTITQKLTAFCEKSMREDRVHSYSFASTAYVTAYDHATPPMWGKTRQDDVYSQVEMGWDAHLLADYQLGAAYADNNPLLLGEAADIAQAQITALFPGNALYLMNAAVFDRTFYKATGKPISEKGYYHLEFHQVFHGIPYMGSVHSAFSVKAVGNEDYWLEKRGCASADVFDADAFLLACWFYQETGVLHSDIPLLPFDSVKGNVEALIYAGYVRAVDRVALGYVQFVDTFVIQYEKEFYGKMFKDSEIAFVYVYTKPVNIDELTLQKEELDGVEWFNLEYVYDECRKHNQKFCAPVGGLEIVRRFVRGTGL